MTETRLKPSPFCGGKAYIELKAENKRLREALERIVSEHPACFEDADCPHKGGAGYDQGCLSCPWVIAEETLRFSAMAEADEKVKSLLNDKQ